MMNGPGQWPLWGSLGALENECYVNLYFLLELACGFARVISMEDMYFSIPIATCMYAKFHGERLSR